MIDAVLPGRNEKLAVAVALGVFAALASAAAKLSLILAAALLAIPLCLWTLVTPAAWLGLFLFSAMLLPPLPISIGDTGPHPCLIFAALGLVVGLIRLEQWKIPADLLTASFFLLVCVLGGSLAPAAVYSGAGIAAGSLARVGLFAISVYVFFYVRSGPGGAGFQPAGPQAFRHARLMFAAAVAGAVFALLDFYFQFPAPAGFGAQFIWLDSGVYRRAQGLFYEASTLGNFCAFFLVMAGVALVRPASTRPMARSALIGGSVVLAAALLLSYSRASLLGLAAAALALLWLNRSRLRLARLALGGAVAAALFAAVVFFVFPVFTETYFSRLAHSAEYFTTAPEMVLSGRLSTWRLLGDFLAQHPWHALLGVGYKTLPYSSFTGRAAVADNMYLSLLVETGIPGLGALLLLSFAMLRASLRAARSGDPRRSFFGAWFFCFWVGQMFQMMSGDLLTYWRVLPVYFWVLAIAAREPVPAGAQ